MLRIENVLAAVRKHKPCSRRQLYRYLQELGIKPSKRLRPALYPDDTSAEVLVHIGFQEWPLPSKNRLPSMNELRAEKAKARGSK